VFIAGAKRQGARCRPPLSNSDSRHRGAETRDVISRDVIPYVTPSRVISYVHEGNLGDRINRRDVLASWRPASHTRGDVCIRQERSGSHA